MQAGFPELHMTRIDNAVPVLRVADVGRSIAWYERVLGFKAECFPDTPPYDFAILNRDGAEIMLQRVSPPEQAGPPSQESWSVYLRLAGEHILELHERVKGETAVLAGPWRRFYCNVEFEIADPDGHRLCLGEVLPDTVNVPSPPE
jgi:catechol 2,3-dioxygenase-like lactoylglutathione lyase family enzyme